MFEVGSAEYRQAAMALNYNLEALYRKNLSFFRDTDQTLYNIYKDYTPKKLTIRLDPKGYLNLYNISSGMPVYQENPTDYAVKQVSYHLSNRNRVNLNLNIHPFEYDDFYYTQCIRRLEERFQSFDTNHVAEEHRLNVPVLFMFGAGMFLQLEHLLNNLDVKRLVIYEPNNDSFYASLHLIDWSEIYRYFDRDGYSLNLMLLDSDTASLHKMRSYITSIGFHHFPHYETIFHYHNDALVKQAESLQSLLQITISSVGYVDDERIGLAHSVANIRKAKGYCIRGTDNPAPTNSTPIFLVGNGPSLDVQADYIAQNKGKALIVSCGTSLGTLLKKGITPDLHLEQERLEVVADNIRKSSTVDQRQGIPLLVLNPCHPVVLELFEDAYILNKTEDLGTEFLSSVLELPIAQLKHCNPVVANFALSAMLSLGFNNIHLFGVDCGMPDTDFHHSKDSVLHYNEGVEDRSRRAKIFNSGQFEIKGNKQQKVITTPTLNLSRIQLEALLTLFKPDCSNSCDGAYIEGTTSTVLEQLKLNSTLLDKPKILSELFHNNFETLEVEERTVKAKLDELIVNVDAICNEVKQKYRHALLSDSSFSGPLDEIDRLINAFYETDKANYMLLSGSFRGISFKLSTAKNILSSKDFEQYKEVFLIEVERFIDAVIQQCKNNILSYH